MKKTLAILLALVMLFTLAACGEKNTNSTGSDNPDANGSPASTGSETTGAYADKTIGFCGMTLNNEYHVVVANAAKAEAKEQGVNILIQAGSEHASVDEQISILENFIAQDVDGIVLVPASSEEMCIRDSTGWACPNTRAWAGITPWATENPSSARHCSICCPGRQNTAFQRGSNDLL